MYYFVVNPNSRSGAGRMIWGQIHAQLLRRKIKFQYYFTQYVGHAKKLTSEICRNASPDSPLTLVAVGGDGTISEVLTGLSHPENILFGFIPTGSGNDFCRSMHLPTDPMEALNSILEKKRVISMDIPRLMTGKRGCRFGISAGIGYDAAVCQEVAASPAKKMLNRLGLGKLIYLAVALKQLAFITPTPMQLTLDGNRRCHFSRVYFCAVMNQKYEGGGFKFCPAARPGDGVLDVIVVEGISKLKLLLCLPTAFFGKHTHFRGIHILRCRSINVKSAVPLAVHRDGESGGIRDNFTVFLEKTSLKIIMPVL